MLPVAVARPCSDGVAIRYVLPVLWMTSCFHTVHGPYRASCVVRNGRSCCIDSNQILLSDEDGQVCVLRSGGEVCYVRLPCADV